MINRNQIMRLIALLLILLTFLLFLVWNAGLISLPLLHSPIPKGDETGGDGTSDVPSTDAPNTDRVTTGSSGGESSGAPDTAPSDTDVSIVIPSAEELLAQGSQMRTEYDSQTAILARQALASTLASLPKLFGTRETMTVQRVETQTAGIAIREETVYAPILSIEPYMGFLIAHTEGNTYLLDNTGTVLNDEFPDCILIYDRDRFSRPVVKKENRYYAITESGRLTEITYQPSGSGVYVDAETTPVQKYPEIFSEIVPVFWKVEEKDRENYPEGTVFYTEEQKEAILDGMSPEDALIRFPAETDAKTGGEESSDIGTSDSAHAESSMSGEQTNAPTDDEASSGDATTSDDAASLDDETTSDDATTSDDTTAPSDTTALDETTAPDDTTSPVETDPPITDPEPEPEPVIVWALTYETRYGYRAENGTVLVAPKYICAYPFGENGLAAATKYNETVKAEVLVFLNKNGKEVIDVSGDLLWYYTVNRNSVYDGYYPALTSDESAIGSYFFEDGYVMVRRRLVIWDRITYAYSDEEILLSENGEIFPIPDGYSLKGYSCGILLLEKDGKYGYMNTHGQWIAQPIYTEAHPFYGGLAAVKRGEKWGMIDSDGRTVLSFAYESVSNCSAGCIAAYSEENGWELFGIFERTENT